MKVRFILAILISRVSIIVTCSDDNEKQNPQGRVLRRPSADRLPRKDSEWGRHVTERDIVEDEDFYRFLIDHELSLSMPTSPSPPASQPTLAPSPAPRPSLTPTPPSTPPPTVAPRPTSRPSPTPTPPSTPAPTPTTMAPDTLFPTTQQPPSSSPPINLPDISSWKQIGQEAEGSVVSLSANADIMAVGIRNEVDPVDRSVAVRVFRRVQDAWKQMGTDILGPPLAIGDTFMNLVYVDLSGEGNRVAMATMSGRNSLEGGTRQRRGRVQIFEWNGVNNWDQVGEDVDGEPLDEFGYSASLSSDGSIFAAGAPYGPNRRGPGHVRVLQLDSATKLWVPFGQTLNGTYLENESGFGYSLDLSDTGRTLVVGAPFNTVDGKIWAGRVHVFQYVNEQWEPFGQTIEGPIELDQFGGKVAISNDGRTIATDAISSTGQARGLVRVYRYKDGTKKWEQLGSTLVGEAVPNIFGEDLDLSARGNIIAIGDTQFPFDQTGGKGYVRVMGYNGTDWETLGPLLTGEAPDIRSFGRSVAVDDSGTTVGTAWKVDDDAYVGVYEAVI